MGMRFADRVQAGRQLADALRQFRGRQDAVMVGLARGGVPVTAAAAKPLGLAFTALQVRKLGIPGHDETAFGALAWSGGQVVRVLNRPFVEQLLKLGIQPAALAEVEHRERAELERRAEAYPGVGPGVGPDIHGRTVILADDGMATGATMRVAVEAVTGAGAASIVVAVPVASLYAQNSLEDAADAVLSLFIPGEFRAVGSYYRTFPQVTDADVVRLLEGPQP
jgi:putative phosphoribosyl transferase